MPPRALGNRYGALVMLSMPPATITCALPATSRSCASIAASIAEPHILFTVVQAVARDSPRVDACALDRRLDRDRAQLVGRQACEVALESADRCAYGADDDDGIVL